MREMKDSGIPWIGEIPKEWVICKVKNVVSHIGSGTTPTSGKIEFYENGTVNWIQSGDLYETNKINETNKKVSESAIKLFPALHIYKAKFIVIAMYGASVGNIAISNIDACVNQACCCIKTDEFNNLKYMFYWLFSCKNDFLKITDGGGQPNISQTKIKNQYYLKPPIEEQHRIADYLDTKCARIDSIRKNVEAEIEALKQYKKSVITEAVTKGLNKNVEMKDSGIPWIGNIPKKWQIVPLKRLVLMPIKDGTHQTPTYTESSNGIPFLSSGNVRTGKINWENIKYITPELHEKLSKEVKPQINDILLAKNGTTGVAAIVDKNYIFDVYVTLAVIRANPQYLIPRFLLYAINSNISKYQFNKSLKGIGTPNLHLDEINKTRILVPTLAEQCQIADFLDSKCARIDSIIQKKQELLTKLDTYKKSLIYEYVTGKKEVPTV